MKSVAEKLLPTLIAVALFFTMPLCLSASDWPQFKGDVAKSSFDSDNPLDKDLFLKWQASGINSPKTVNYSAPIVVGDRVYAGTSDGSLIAFDLSPFAPSLNPVSGTSKPRLPFPFPAPFPNNNVPLPVPAAIQNASLWKFQTDGSIYGAPANWKTRKRL